MGVPIVPLPSGEVGGDRGGPLLQDGGDEEATPHQELLVYVVGLWVGWELEEQRSHNGCSQSVAGGDGAVGLVEEGVVEGEETVSDG